jgi:Zn-dependent oligopeptidase
MQQISQDMPVPKPREQMNIHYKNRAYPVNIPVLDSLLYYRQDMRKYLATKSYAAYALTDKMAGTAGGMEFENAC